MQTNRALDPIAVEVIRNSLISAAENMTSSLTRASFNSLIQLALDFAVGIYTAEGEMVAEGTGLPVKAGGFQETVGHIVNYYGKDNLEDGDCILSTWSFWTGVHTQDVCVMKPVFIDGDLSYFTCSKAHWMDVGGIDVMKVNTVDIWQEGIQIKAVKIVKKGVLDKELAELLQSNSRTPYFLMGDLNAQIGCCEAGAKKIHEIVGKYGRDVVASAVTRILDNGEQIIRKAIAEMPDGEWTEEGIADNDGISDDPVKLKVTIRIDGDEMTFDSTGSASQQMGPINCPYPGTCSFARMVLLMVAAPNYAPNGGCFRPLKVVAPEGSLFNAQPPCPTQLYGWPTSTLAALALKALSRAVPDKLTASDGLEPGAFSYRGFLSDGTFFAGADWSPSGQGAAQDSDGESAMNSFWLSPLHGIPVEVIEQRYPKSIVKQELRQDSGGPGRFRGGLGIEKTWRAGANMRVIWALEHMKTAPWGLFGGHDGARNIALIHAGSSKEESVNKSISEHVVGEEWRFYSGGGGGWGNPFERDPKLVLKDVIGEYVSVEGARREYGVAIREVDGEYVLDEAETRRLRA